MDPLLVVGSAEVRCRLETWLTDALPAVFSGRALKDFRSRITAMAEFALATLVCGSPGAAWSARVAGLLALHYREKRFVQSLMSEPASAPAHAWIVEALHRHGVDSLVALDAVRRLLRLRSQLPVFGGYPLLRMEALYLEQRLARVAGAGIDSEAAVAFSSPQSLSSGREIYELAHAVFFLTCFGRYHWRPGLEALAPQRPELFRGLEQAASMAVQDAHWDLVGEVALAFLYLGQQAQADALLQLLAGAQWADGAIPGWQGARGIAGLYHATLIALVAFTTARHPVVAG
jgi:hypothetical protein